MGHNTLSFLTIFLIICLKGYEFIVSMAKSYLFLFFITTTSFPSDKYFLHLFYLVIDGKSLECYHILELHPQDRYQKSGSQGMGIKIAPALQLRHKVEPPTISIYIFTLDLR